MRGVNKLILCQAEMRRIVAAGLNEKVLNFQTGSNTEVSFVSTQDGMFVITLNERQQTKEKK